MNEDTEQPKTRRKTVLLFKAPKEGEEEQDPYIQELTGVGHTAVCIPVLGFTFINTPQYSELLKHPDTFSAIVFTSQRSVEATARALHLLEEEEQTLQEKRHDCLDLKCYAVGASTQRTAKDAGFSPVDSDCGNANNLVDFISRDMSDRDKPLLYPCGNLRLDTLPSQLTQLGFLLKEIMVYETTKDPSLETNLESAIKDQGVPDYVVYFSPSGVDFAQPVMSTYLSASNQSQVIAIGPSTKKALDKRGVPVSGMCKKPDAKSLVETIAQIENSVCAS